MKVISAQKMRGKPFQNRTSRVWGDGILNTRADRRAHDRIPARIQARFFFGSRVYAGDILDISEKGMFINTDMRLPVNAKIEIMILVNNKVMKLPVAVRRSVGPDNSEGTIKNSGMGVELTCPVQNYTDFLNSLTPFHCN